MTIQQDTFPITQSPLIRSKGLADLNVRSNWNSKLSQVADRSDLDLGLPSHRHQDCNFEAATTD